MRIKLNLHRPAFTLPDIMGQKAIAGRRTCIFCVFLSEETSLRDILYSPQQCLIVKTIREKWRQQSQCSTVILKQGTNYGQFEPHTDES